MSILISTYLIYFVSLWLGFSKFSILISFGLITIWFIIYFIKNKRIEINFPKEHRIGLILSLSVFFIYFIALYPAIFQEYKGYIVMAGSNWQDTAMHQGIIESISQGNFPPQAPHYAGVPLKYYYFVDFHTAIISTLYGRFFPRILVYDNPFFAAIFIFSLYILAYELTKKRVVALCSAFTGTFFSSYLFVHFF